MLEIVLLIFCGKKIAAMCRDRDRTAWPWVLLMIAFWYGGAIAGGIIGLVISTANDPVTEEPNLAVVIPLVLAGAVAGLVYLMALVTALPPAGRPDRFADDGDDDDDRRRGDDYRRDRYGDR